MLDSGGPTLALKSSSDFDLAEVLDSGGPTLALKSSSDFDLATMA